MADTRICCLGNSTMNGQPGVSTSPFRPGCRGVLRDSLNAHGVPVQMVGSLSDTGGGHEGHDGWMVSDGRVNAAQIAASQQPDIWCVDFGLNDLYGSFSSPDTRINAIHNMDGLLKAIRLATPLSKVIVTAIPVPPTDIAGQVGMTQSAAISYNAQLPLICADNGAMFVNPRLVTETDLADGIHPNAGGYDKMAIAFYQACLAIVATSRIMLTGITVQAAAGAAPLLIPSISVTIGGATYSAANVSLPGTTGTYSAANVPLLRMP